MEESYKYETVDVALTMYMGEPHSVAAMPPSGIMRAKPKSAAT